MGFCHDYPSTSLKSAVIEVISGAMYHYKMGKLCSIPTRRAACPTYSFLPSFFLGLLSFMSPSSQSQSREGESWAFHQTYNHNGDCVHRPILFLCLRHTQLRQQQQRRRRRLREGGRRGEHCISLQPEVMSSPLARSLVLAALLHIFISLHNI